MLAQVLQCLVARGAQRFPYGRRYVLQQLQQRFAGVFLQQERITGGQVGEYAEILGMIRHHEKVQRPAQAYCLPVVGDDRLTLGETIGLIRCQPVTIAVGIPGEVGMYMGVAPVDIGSVRLIDMG